MAENVKVNYIYADAEEKYVKAVVLYAYESALYYDEAHEHAVNGADVLNFFLKGLVVNIYGNYAVATGYTVDVVNNKVMISYYNAEEYGEAEAPIVTEE